MAQQLSDREIQWQARAQLAIAAIVRPEYDAHELGYGQGLQRFTQDEAQAIIAIVEDVVDGHVETELDRTLRARLSPAVKTYIAQGIKDDEVQL